MQEQRKNEEERGERETAEKIKQETITVLESKQKEEDRLRLVELERLEQEARRVERESPQWERIEGEHQLGAQRGKYYCNYLYYHQKDKSSYSITLEVQYTSGQHLAQEQYGLGQKAAMVTPTKVATRQVAEEIITGGGIANDSLSSEETFRDEEGKQTTCNLARESEYVVWERLEGEKTDHEKFERERVGGEQMEREQVRKEQMEREQMEREQMEKEQMKEQMGQVQLVIERERLEKERLEKERLEKEQLEEERLEKERFERLENARLERPQEGVESERLERERLQSERVEKEKFEKERLEREQFEWLKREKLDKEQQEQVEKEQEERERIEKAEAAYITKVSVAEEERASEEYYLAELEAAHMGRLVEQVVIEEARPMEQENLQEEEHRLNQVREQEQAVEQKQMVAKYHASIAATAAAQAAAFQVHLAQEAEQAPIAEAYLTEEDKHIMMGKYAVEDAHIEAAKHEWLQLEKEEKQPIVEELEKKIDESEKRRLELEIMEAEQKQREEALKLQLQELMEQRERHLVEQQATSRDYRRDRRRARSLQRQKREVSPEYLAETRQRSQEREHMREEERRKEVENVRQAFGLGETATHPKPNNWADLIDNDSDAYDETLPPPPPNLADLIDGPDGIVELDVEDIPAIRIEEVSKTGPWVAPWPIPRLIETVPTPMPGQLRGPPRVLVEGTGFVDGKRQSRPQSRSADRAQTPTLMVPDEGYDYFVYAQDAPAPEPLILSTEQGQTVQTNEHPHTLQPLEASAAFTKLGCHEETLEAEVSSTNDSIGRNTEIVTATPILPATAETDLSIDVFPYVRFHCIPCVQGH